MTTRRKFKKGDRLWYQRGPDKMRATFLSKKGMEGRVYIEIDELPPHLALRRAARKVRWFVKPQEITPMDAISRLGELV